MSNISSIVNDQRNFFLSQETKDVNFRINQLKKLKTALSNNITNITDALKLDLNKSSAESYLTEIGLIFGEINHAISQLKKWAKPQKVGSKIFLFPAKSRIFSEPYGVVLIMAPWNYPFQLNMAPLVGAISAGNCITIKPSNYAPNTSKIISDIISKTFNPEYITVIQGGRDINSELLEEKFDYIFFTGGKTVGKLVMQKAANHLTPISLELGGKSPCIVDETADLDLAAKRIVWGKFLNAGQTCIAPDYVLVMESIKEIFIQKVQSQVQHFFSNNLQPEYSKIITQKHFERICKYIDGSDNSNGKIICGGMTNSETLQIYPTVLCDAEINSPVMSEEIFGPVLPIITIKDINQAISIIQNKDRPLALYYFTRNKKLAKKIISTLEYGGGCINDVIMHISSSMPFGGISESGMGCYHGKYSFDTFSHKKSVLINNTSLDFEIRYPPYDTKKTNLIKSLLN